MVMITINNNKKKKKISYCSYGFMFAKYEGMTFSMNEKDTYSTEHPEDTITTLYFTLLIMNSILLRMSIYIFIPIYNIRIIIQ